MTLSFRMFKFWEYIATRGTRLFGGTRTTADKVKGNIIAKYLAGHYKVSRIKNPQTTDPKPVDNIWQFWDGPEPNEVVRACWRTVERYKGNRNQIILNMKTLPNYSDLPGIIYDRLKRGEICWANFSDVVRINLLKNHGGFWMDSTNYMTSPFPKLIDEQPFFVYRDEILTPKAFIQSCFIRSTKDNFLATALNDLIVEYWRREDKAVDYFVFHLMFRALVEHNKTAKQMFAQMPQIDQIVTHRVNGGSHMAHVKLLTKFDASEYERLIQDSFFQKLTFKDLPSALPADSYLAEMVKRSGV